MNKKKARVCTTMFIVITCSLIFAAMYYEAFGDTTYFDLMAPFFGGYFIGTKTKEFYHWLQK